MSIGVSFGGVSTSGAGEPPTIGQSASMKLGHAAVGESGSGRGETLTRPVWWWAPV